MGCSFACLRRRSPIGTQHDSDEAEGPDLDPNGRGRLSETQSRVMADARRRAQIASNAAISELEDRFQKLGYNQGDLDRALRYFRDKAPIIVHFNPRRIVKEGWLTDRTVLDSFRKDTHYRSVFETGVTGAAAYISEREEKERALFLGQYDQGSAPGERPKYGSVNEYRTPRGTARLFGRCYFELHADVRARCTFTYGNSTDALTQTVATCAHFAHVLVRFTDEELRCLVERKAYAPTLTYFAVEAQVHGPIEFKRDIAEVRFEESDPPRLRRKLRKWADRNGFGMRSYAL